MKRIGLAFLILVWAMLMVPILFLASVPTSTAVQGLLALGTLATILVLKPFVHVSLAVRFLVLAAASVFVLRYWVWRLTDTLPPLDEPLSFAIAAILFAAETFTVGLFFLTALITGDPVARSAAPKVRIDQLPKVDILVPSYNEADELLAVTLAAAKQVTYPEDRKTVVLCDDGGTDQRCNHSDPAVAQAAKDRRARLQKLCEEMGVVYSTRARNDHAKAGNLNAALETLDGELVLVLDADHIPSRDFLARTVGYFVENPRLFLVQTPHFFTNRDPIERNLGLTEVCPTENEMFYGEIHRGLDRLGGAFFCGSAALLRRRALDEVGGISGVTITEDAETALDIHSRGWQSLYLDHAMIAGLQPETFATFIQQRGRWATGMIQMLMLKNPVFRSGLTMSQRLCYLNSMSFWLFPLVRTIFLVSPLFYLFFGLQIFVVDSRDVVAYILPYVLIGFLIQNALFAHVRWPQVSEVYEIAQTPYLMSAIFNTVVRPRSATFKVTAKEETLDHAFLSPIYLPLLGLVGLLFLGLVAGGVRWVAFPGDRAVVQIVGAWSLYNFLLAAFALRAVFERPRRVVKPRTAVSAPARLWLPGVAERGEAIDATIISMSGSKMQIRIEEGSRGPDGASRLSRAFKGAVAEVKPTLPKAPDLEASLKGEIAEVQGLPEGIFLQLRFEREAMVRASALTAYVIYGDSKRWQFFRKVLPRRRGLLSGLIYVLGMGAVSVPRTMLDLLREPGRRRREDGEANEVPGDAFAAAETKSAPKAQAVAGTGAAPVYLEVED